MCIYSKVVMLNPITEYDSELLRAILIMDYYRQFYEKPKFVSSKMAQAIIKLLVENKESDYFSVDFRAYGERIGIAGFHNINTNKKNAVINVVMQNQDLQYGIHHRSTILKTLLHGFMKLGLSRVYSDFPPENSKYISFLKNLGFSEVITEENGLRMEISKRKFMFRALASCKIFFILLVLENKKSIGRFWY